MLLRIFYCWIFIFFLETLHLKAQVRDTICNLDTIASTCKKYIIKPTTDFDQRFSFIHGKHVNIWGQRVGILVNGKFKVGIGGYFLNDKLKSIKVYPDGTPYTYFKRNLTFGTVYFEPFLFRKTYWELSVPFEIGIGRSYGKTYDNTTNTFLGSTTTTFFPSGVGLSFSLKPPAFFGVRPFRWIGINFLAGYRYNFLESISNTDYDGAFWSISGAVFLDKIVDDCRYWKKKKANAKTKHTQ